MRTSRTTLAQRLFVPWVQERHAGCLEVNDIAGDDRQAMHQRCRRDKSVPVRLGVWHMQARAAPGDGSVNR